MSYCGLDVGSRTIKLVVLDNGIQDSTIVETGARPLKRCRELLNGRSYKQLVVTGYGRHLVAPALGGKVISEIKAHALGVRCICHDSHTVIDVGGQDSKVILLSENGGVRKFEMNDRCAAGTGKFLEVMATALEVSIDKLGELALSASKSLLITSLCTVFAESEVVSLIAKGEDTGAIALGLHEAISTRIVSMAKRTGIKERVVFTGGAALNKCLVSLISKKLGVEVMVPKNPQITGALGAALMAEGERVIADHS